ncbi:EamA family transporter [Aureimonas pseudogalii]|uniref:Drug/metabolite transporter (DMT)-like permease n=1 Tax=Aureimonas pseudogalii TaxID=1744844 RepID=A0A7W6H6J1_9HYPH|nr:EamA family transporter [Aureimonas pseudogalii]MBB3999499.1 drug/metabolite transporter (DMT)-like permease [Aureimonas pseudogalii]
MSPLVVALALSAALAHATWNAFLRSSADRLQVVMVMSLAMVPVALPFALVLPLPPMGAWPFIGLSSALQVAYSLFLVAAYRHGDLGQVYPVVRGTVPVLVSLGGFLVVGQTLSSASVAGIALIVFGILGLTGGRGRISAVSLLWATGTGAIVAVYATVDALGVRTAGDPLAYTAWICLLFGTLLPLAVWVARGRLAIDLRSRETWKAAVGGFVSLAAYGLVIAAFALGPAGPVTALRETSVVFAALLGSAFLSEALSWRRLLACIAVAAGAISIGLS